MAFWAASIAVFASGPWTRLDGCVLVPNLHNDGDSFRVRHDGKEYIFRLYYVDVPEQDAEFPQRVREQADYFGIEPAQLSEVGRAAAETVRARLSQPFTVITRWHGAQGRSVTPRFYAFVEANGRDLAEELIESGLARVFGVRVTRPDGERAGDYRARLLKMEDRARESKAGAWAWSQPLRQPYERPLRSDMPVVIAPRTVALYSMDLPRRRIGEMNRNTSVRIVEEFADGWVHIEFESDAGETIESFCLRWDLSLPDPAPGAEPLRASLFPETSVPRAR
jgi:endonuclease YncB( thermonuclease family)